MKKNWLKWALCLVLAVGMLTCVALAAEGDLDVAVYDADIGATITGTGGELSVSVPADKVTPGAQYAFLVVEIDKSMVTVTNPDTATAATLKTDVETAVAAGKTPYNVNEEKILYINQDAPADGPLVFTGTPLRVTDSVILLGGVFPGQTEAEAPKILGVIKGHGVTVTGTATAKGATSGNVTVTIKDGDTEVGTATVATGATYTIAGVPSKAGLTVEVSSDIKGEKLTTVNKFVTRTYELDTTAATTLNVELWPKGDANGDGKVNVNDTTAIFSHARFGSTNKLEGYALACADANGDGNVNINDTTAIFSHLRFGSTNVLW